MNAVDTLVVDSANLNAWRSNDDFDYGRELTQSDFSVMDWIQQQIYQLWHALTDNAFYTNYGDVMWFAIGVVVLLALVYVLFRTHPELFVRNGGKASDLFGGRRYHLWHRFRPKPSQPHWRKAIIGRRWEWFLQTLKALSDNAQIDWQPYKTPTQYTKEVTTSDFRTFTNHFLRVRYGNFEATQAPWATRWNVFRRIYWKEGQAMKGSRIFIVCITLFLLVMFLIQLQMPKQFSWTPTFAHDDRNPFGCYVVDSMLSHAMPNGYTVQNKTLYQLSKETKKQGVLIVSNSLNLSEIPISSRWRILWNVAERWWLLVGLQIMTVQRWTVCCLQIPDALQQRLPIFWPFCFA